MKSIDARLTCEQTSERDHVVRHIDAALSAHLTTFRDAFFDVLAALLTLLIFATSFIHAIIRMAYALVGVILWTLALWMTLLQIAQRKVVARSQTSSFLREVQHE